MDGKKTVLERAFELARSGGFKGVGDLRKALYREGFDVSQIEGRQLQIQLRELVRGSRQRTDVSRP